MAADYHHEKLESLMDEINGKDLSSITKKATSTKCRKLENVCEAVEYKAEERVCPVCGSDADYGLIWKWI